MQSEAFKPLLTKLVGGGGISEGRSISAAQKLILFLKIAGHGDVYSAIQEQFQHSKSTISAIFHEVLQALVDLHREVVRPPSLASIQSRLGGVDRLQDLKYHAFAECVGAIDGSHI